MLALAKVMSYCGILEKVSKYGGIMTFKDFDHQIKPILKGSENNRQLLKELPYELKLEMLLETYEKIKQQEVYQTKRSEEEEMRLFKGQIRQAQMKKVQANNTKVEKALIQK